jgi:hypothetical protein
MAGFQSETKDQRESKSSSSEEWTGQERKSGNFRQKAGDGVGHGNRPVRPAAVQKVQQCVNNH